jgi:hypothetical protein
MLLYSPRSNHAFYAHYRSSEGKPYGTFGSLDFSDDANLAGNEKYKTFLQKEMNKKLGQ